LQQQPLRVPPPIASPPRQPRIPNPGHLRSSRERRSKASDSAGKWALRSWGCCFRKRKCWRCGGARVPRGMFRCSAGMRARRRWRTSR
jgi:hypothetical protein